MVDSNGAARAVWVAVTTKNTSTRVKWMDINRNDS
jgi:hypothetical protein